MDKKKWFGRILTAVLLLGFSVSGISDSAQGAAEKARRADGAVLENMQKDSTDTDLPEETET